MPGSAASSRARAVRRPDPRRHLGAVYTPAAEVAVTCDAAIEHWLGGRPRAALGHATVCDPACGDGAFLEGFRRAAAVEPASLVGVDVDGVAAAAAGARLPTARIYHGDALVTTGGSFAWGRQAPAVFDLVVGNPPWVRYQELADPLGRPGPYAARIQTAVARLAPGLRLSGRSDLSAAFLVLGASLLAPGGVLAFVTSAAWLDAAYGEPLGRHLLDAGLVEIIDRPAERSFGAASVSSCVVVVRAGADGPVRFRAIGRRGHLRLVPRAQLARTSKWGGRILRAPPILARLEHGLAGGATLAELATVRGYLVSGCDDVFYLDRERAVALGLDPACLRPLVKSTRGERRILLRGPARRVLFSCSDPEAYAGTATGAYLAEATARGVPERSGVRVRRPWCAIDQRPGAVLCVRTARERHLAYLNPEGLASGELYRVDPRPGLPVAALAAWLQSATAGLQLEALGRAYGGGGGPLKIERADLVGLRLPPPPALVEAAPALAAALAPLLERPIGTVAEEAGAADRAPLERLCVELAGLPGHLADELRAAHATTVNRRVRRADRVLAS